ncbi:MAG: NAD(P)/FAD-dependent oxidoreductase [Candidatus Omnitrophica bacterium]|nr:NAD(P)/FAD-dependent oxidoreductase [Candidatus Omnitrophota bacterium]MDD5671241.1 NAD(P)/FAD-dependent oxidoreductase [Candidatus Omnitrophota bacterium]
MDDVIIVGGGHAGLYTAYRLACEGLRVRLFDQKDKIGYSVVCTGVIGAEAFSKFDLPKEHIIGAVQNVRFVSPFGTVLDYSPPAPLAWIVDRARFNLHFAEQALGHGAQIITSARVTDIHIKKQNVSVCTVLQDGEVKTWDAKAIVLATGVNYKLFDAVDLIPAKKFLCGAQAQIPYEGDDRTQIYVGREVAPGAFAWVAPINHRGARVGLLCEEQPLIYIRRLLDLVRPGWRDDIPESDIEVRPVAQGPIDRSYTDRVLVVGEAAGQIKTTTGGGIYYGLLGAEFAVETLKKAFQKNQFKASFLSNYERLWKKRIADELQFGYYFRKLFSKFSDEQIEEFLSRVKEEDVLNALQQEADFDWHKSVIFSIFNIPTVRRMIQQPF